MPHLFKPTVIRYVDAQGKRTNKGTPGAIAKKEKAAKYRGSYVAPDGERKTVTLFKDKAASRAELNRLILRDEQIAAGIIDVSNERRNQPIAILIAEFAAYLKSKGNTPEHIKDTISRVRRTFEACQFERVADVDLHRLDLWLSDLQSGLSPATGGELIQGIAHTYQEVAKAFNISVSTVTYWRRQGAPLVPRQPTDLALLAEWHAAWLRSGVSVETRNKFVRSLKTFGNWLMRVRVSRENQFAFLSLKNVAVDRRRVRRVLTDSEVDRLLQATHNSQQSSHGLSGPERFYLYVLALSTGFRASELASLKRGSLLEQNGMAYVRLEACHSKRRKQEMQPLKQDVFQLLQSWQNAEERSPDDSLWPGRWVDKSAEMLRVDLEHINRNRSGSRRGGWCCGTPFP